MRNSLDSLTRIEKRLNFLKAQREVYKTQLDELKDREKKLTKEHQNCAIVQQILSDVGIATQQQVSIHIQDIVSTAMMSVFPDPYKFDVEFILNRKQTECLLRFVDSKGQKIVPLNSSGGGVVDVASFALRIACWTITQPKTRSLLILDEPFRYLSRDLLSQGGEMLKQVADKLNLQIILITHEEPLIEIGDKIFHVTKSGKGVSKIRETLKENV